MRITNLIRVLTLEEAITISYKGSQILAIHPLKSTNPINHK